MLTVTSPLPQASPVRSLLQANVACLAAFAGGIFAAAEGGPLAAATIPIALCGLLWTDYKRTFFLPPWLANSLGFLAFLAAGYEFFGESLEGRLLAFGHLLFYLSWILLLQKKETPQFWWLCALSVLQVATSSVLTNNMWLGLSLVLYVLFALWTLSVFSLDRAVQRSTRTVSSSASDATNRMTSPDETSISRNTVMLESAQGWITTRFVTGVVANGLLSIFVGLVFFVITPRVRIGENTFLDIRTKAVVRSTTGFSEEVSVGDMGEILENHDLVLEASFNDVSSREPITAEEYAARLGDDAPLFRGAVLGTYENGRWSALDVIRQEQQAEKDVSQFQLPLVEQVIHIHPIGTDILFSCGSTLSCLPDDKHNLFRTRFDRLGNTYRRVGKTSELQNASEPFKYYAYSLANERRRLWSVNPRTEARYLRIMTRVPPGLGPLRELAEQVTRSEADTPLAPTEAIDRLVSLLRDSSRYSYSLDLSISDPTVDPVVDFVMNRQKGHCEYFASALVLMLRSIDIPARYVNGFKGGTYNHDTGQTEVRQLHAHAWVEAYVDGEWIVLDPTPAARDQSVSKISKSSHFWADMTKTLRDVWSSGLTLSGDQQRQMFLQPLKESTSGLFNSFETLASMFTLGKSGDGQTSRASRSVILRIAMGLAGVVTLLATISWLIKRRGGLHRQQRPSDFTRQQREAPTVAFYERFLAILAQRGHRRGDAQTPREFAISLDQHLQTHELSNGASQIPESLTTAFYEVRFGRAVLPPAQIEDLNTSLNQLERSLQTGTP